MEVITKTPDLSDYERENRRKHITIAFLEMAEPACDAGPEFRSESASDLRTGDFKTLETSEKPHCNHENKR